MTMLTHPEHYVMKDQRILIESNVGDEPYQRDVGTVLSRNGFKHEML
jgi:hypothetical protein